MRIFCSVGAASRNCRVGTPHVDDTRLVAAADGKEQFVLIHLYTYRAQGTEVSNGSPPPKNFLKEAACKKRHTGQNLNCAFFFKISYALKRRLIIAKSTPIHLDT